MNKIRSAALLASLTALPLAMTVPAFAAQDGTYQVPLTQLNDSGASGTALVELNGTKLTVDIKASGLVPNSPHAQHFHGGTSGKNFECPTPADVKAADADGNGVLSTTEAASFYGPIMISLTTTGDTSMDSGLAVDRFPKADADGNLTYHRTITISSDLAKSLTDLHIVQHGIDGNGNGKYDGDAKSDLDPSLPAEATDPADCGALSPAQMQGAPSGGVATGGGSGGAAPSAPLFALGGLALLGAGGAVALRRRSAAAGR